MIRFCRCGSGHTFETGSDYGYHSRQWDPECKNESALKALAHREYMQTYMKLKRHRAEKRAEAQERDRG